MRVALCQMNATVGDIDGNLARLQAGLAAARAAGAELVLFPELAITGYPPEDLLLRERFLADTRAALERFAVEVADTVAIVGFPERAEHVYNSAAVLANGRLHGCYRKVHLPNYGVFDEHRYFKAAERAAVVTIGAQRVGVTICEDMWEPGPPAADEALAGASLIVNISASPYHAGKAQERERMFAQRAREHHACIAFCGLVGGQDELLFDGASCVLDHTGRTLARAAQFAEELLVCEVDLEAAAAARLRAGAHRPPAERSKAAVLELPAIAAPARKAAAPQTASRLAPAIAPLEQEVYTALCLGLRDYVEKNGFSAVVFGLSGGIDSALVACLASDALGAERVNVAIMPSPYSSQATQADARALAHALEINAHELPIAPAMDAYAGMLAGELAGDGAGVTEENLQARIRGNLLMALSNEFGWLVLATGNKSEMSVGYTTLYGDLAGGFAVIKDVPKTLVYSLCNWRNSAAGASSEHERLGDGRHSRVAQPIPPSIIARAPSAELRADQRDEDSLPPYPVLDRILQGYIELDFSRDRLIADGLPAAQVDHAIGLVDRAEYKRRQAPPGIKISSRAFGRDRRMPITNRYKERG